MYKGTIAVCPTIEDLTILQEAGVVIKTPSIILDVEVESLDALDEYWGRFIWSLEQYLGNYPTGEEAKILAFPQRRDE